MKNILIANFKMNKTSMECKEYIDKLLTLIPVENKINTKIVLCLPFSSLYLTSDYKGRGLNFGAQNIHEEESGQYTGEINAKMIKEFNVNSVLIGHSERKKYFNETNERINKKIKTALRFGFEIILCVGETRGQKNTGKTFSTLQKQIVEALNGIYENELKNIIIAYEPVWAVGTGLLAGNNDITKAAEEIRKIIINSYSVNAGNNIRIIYGGSITEKNSEKIFKNKQIVGALVGGASLDPIGFSKIIL
ncbi:MAG: triose-phosphate isomerase [Clostridia bacterium]|nr:triose-phosphate isomerase [Clostridia bacterium]